MLVKEQVFVLLIGPLCKIFTEMLFVFKFKVGHLGELPKEIPPEAEKNEDFLRKAHHVLLEVNFVAVSFAFC